MYLEAHVLDDISASTTVSAGEVVFTSVCRYIEKMHKKKNNYQRLKPLLRVHGVKECPDVF